MSIEHVASGERGEELALAFLKRYFSISPLRPDLGIDLGGFYRRSKTLVPFAFQVKNARRFTFERSSTLRRLLAAIDRQPVILLHVEAQSSRAQRYSFRILHDWMLENPDWHLRIDRQKSLSIDLDEFVEIEEDDLNFLRAVEEEISRIIGDGHSLWSVRRWRGLPVCEPELFSYFGHLCDLEVDARTLAQMSGFGSPAWQEGQWCLIRDTLSVTGELQKSLASWRERLKILPDPMKSDLEMRAFAQFVSAMRLHLLEPRLRESGENSLSTAFLLIATLANVEDLVLTERAQRTLEEVASEYSVHRALTFEQYRVLANYYAARCEAGDDRDASRCVDFHRRHEESWQIQWQQAYYESDLDECARAAYIKLTNPNLRQLKTRKLEEWRLTLFRRLGVKPNLGRAPLFA